MSSIKKNFIYNFIYQILVFVLPLITVPYVSRVIGPVGVGQYSYTYSITYYFMIFAMLGINNYGNRSIAKIRDYKNLMSKTFKEIYVFQFITSIIMVVFYIAYILLFNIQYKTIAFIQCLYVISCMFDINWFFFGIEKFKLTITRNIIIKIISLIFIFIFVRDANDTWIYTLILSLSTLISQLFLWPVLHRYVDDVKISFKDIKKHFLPSLKLFLPVIAVAIYKVMDKTMIGLFSDVSEVGFYENAEKIINVPNSIIAALGTVMLPRMTNIYSKGNNEQARIIIDKSINVMMFFAFAMTFGLIAISKDFSVLFFGSDFSKTGEVIVLLSITILFISWGNVLRTQYLIPKERDKEYIISAFIGAGVNLILNIIFIPKYGSIGACYGTIAAEFFVIFYQTLAVRRELPICHYLIELIPFFFKSIVMYICIYFIQNMHIDIFYKIILQFIFGVIIYLLLNYKYIVNLLKLKK